MAVYVLQREIDEVRLRIYAYCVGIWHEKRAFSDKRFSFLPKDADISRLCRYIQLLQPWIKCQDIRVFSHWIRSQDLHVAQVDQSQLVVFLSGNKCEAGV